MAARISRGLALALWAASTAATAQTAAPAPAPIKGAPVSPARLANGKPNWTGFWAPPGGFLDPPTGGVRIARGANNRDRRRQDIPTMKSPYSEQWDETLKKAATGELPDPIAACFPPGMPRMMGMVYGMEILQTANTVLITSEWQDASRRIWLDLKAHPPADELDPTYAGHSIGHWEGDTLVVETVGIRDDVPLDYTYMPHSPKLKVIERFSMNADNVLVDEITVDDPGLFDKPWTYSVRFVHKPELRLREYVCLENNRNMDSEGRSVFK